jgi:alkylation response protein AidB-like acyl-CoA dehydrogenase
MNFELPAEIHVFLSRIDAFIERDIAPLQQCNIQYFDYRREAARTNWTNRGLPSQEWESLQDRACELADNAGFYRFAYPEQWGGSTTKSKNLYMAAIRYHLSYNHGGGLGLANDLQSEHCVVANNPFIIMLHHYGSTDQRETLIPEVLRGRFRATFGLTEANHGSDATFLETTAKRVHLDDGQEGYEINGNKKWQTGAHRATHCIVFARTSGRAGAARGITAFLVPMTTSGVTIDSYQWTLNMPTDHATVAFDKVRVAATDILGDVDDGLAIAQTFTHENRVRQAASSCGAAQYCIRESVRYAKERLVFGKPLSTNQAIQWPLVELATRVEMLRLLILHTANEMDTLVEACHDDGRKPWVAIEKELGHRIAMCNYAANRLCTEAADRAIQIHGGNGYSRDYPFEHIWRHFRRYRITEGSEEIQIRRIAAHLFGYKTTSLAKDASRL